jgi:hypothetical protein
MLHITLLALLHDTLDPLLPCITLLLLLLLFTSQLLLLMLWLALALAPVPQPLQRLHRLQQDVRSSSSLPCSSQRCQVLPGVTGAATEKRPR